MFPGVFQGFQGLVALTNDRLNGTVTPYFRLLKRMIRQTPMTMMTGAEIVIRCLQEEKVDYVFGYPGGAVLHLYDELFKQDKVPGVRHILTRHEQGTVHAALRDRKSVV